MFASSSGRCAIWIIDCGDERKGFQARQFQYVRRATRHSIRTHAGRVVVPMLGWETVTALRAFIEHGKIRCLCPPLSVGVSAYLSAGPLKNVGFGGRQVLNSLSTW